MEVKYVEVNYKDDDPFIIIKKTNTKKTPVPKTKPVEKRKRRPVVPVKTIIFTVRRDENGTPTIQRFEHYSNQRYKLTKPVKEETLPNPNLKPKEVPIVNPPSVAKV
jgi:hypothetical protein